MARARPKEDPDISSRRAPCNAGLLVPDRILTKNPRDLRRDRGCAPVGIVVREYAQCGMRRAVTERRRRRGDRTVDRKAVILIVLEIVGRPGIPAHLGEQIVDESQQLRDRAKAARNGAPRARAGPQSVDEPAGLMKHGDVGVTKAINRLLAIPDDENRGVRGKALSFAPGIDEQ